MSDKKVLFSEIVNSGGKNPVYCYRSSKTVYEEQLYGGRLTSAGWNGAGFMLNVLDGVPTRQSPDVFGAAQTFGIEANGVELAYGWTAENNECNTYDNDNGVTVTDGVLTLLHTSSGIRVRVCTRLDGTAVLCRWLELENTTGAAVNIGNITVLGGLAEHLDACREYVGSRDAGDIYRVGYFDNSAWAHEGAFRWHELGVAGYSVYGRYAADRFRHPMLLLENRASGGMFAIQFGWTGGYAFDFNLRADGGASDLFFKIRTDGPVPFIRLAPGERYTTPAVHIGYIFGGLDDAVNEMHRHIRSSVVTLPAARGMRGGYVEAGMGPERVMDITATKHFADTAAAVGAETMIIDAGWYCPLGKETSEWHPRAGDWYPDEGHYPNGIGEIRDYIHSKGLLFGLWLDLERIGKQSKIYAEHPDWAMKAANGNITSILDMTNPEAVAWAESELTRVINGYGVDLFRLDYNIGYQDMFCPVRDGETGTARYYAAVYAMYERLRRHFPDVVFENCAGGGGRTDLGMISNFTHTWVSDWQIAPRSVAITNGMTMALPPEYVDRLVSGMKSHTRGSLELMTRQTIFGRPSTNDYNPVGSHSNPEQLDFVRHTFDIYKKYIRPFAPCGNIYHHTPEIYGEMPQGTCILERSARDGEADVIGIFRLSDNADENVTVYPRGLDTSARYALTYDNDGHTATADGFELKNNGIHIRLPGSLTSELLILKRI